MHDVIEDQVLAANQRFYDAFQNRDIDAMDGIWSKAAYVKCVHPGWNALHGWQAIRESWEAIFENGPKMRFTLRDVHLDVFGSVAVVLLVEDIFVQSSDNISRLSVLATNIFERAGNQWLMIHHHGSPVIVSEEAKRFSYN